MNLQDISSIVGQDIQMICSPRCWMRVDAGIYCLQPQVRVPAALAVVPDRVADRWETLGLSPLLSTASRRTERTAS